MITEALGALIILGALLILVVRYISRKPQSTVATEEMQVSTEQLKAELARSGDEVIKRMGSHIEHLEGLLRQADDRTSRLETRLAEYERLESRLDNRIAMLEQELTTARSVTQELTTARTTVPPMTQPSYYQPPVMPTPAPAMPPSDTTLAPAMAPMAPGDGAAMSPLVSEPLTLATATDRADAQSFADVLQQSIERESASMIGTPDAPEQAAGLAEVMRQAELTSPAEAMRQPETTTSAEPPVAIESLAAEPLPAVATAPKAEPVAETTIDESVDPDDTAVQAARARAMLRSGYSTEEIARDTGLGRGAIELLRQIIKKEIEG